MKKVMHFQEFIALENIINDLKKGINNSKLELFAPKFSIKEKLKWYINVDWRKYIYIGKYLSNYIFVFENDYKVFNHEDWKFYNKYC